MSQPLFSKADDPLSKLIENIGLGAVRAELNRFIPT